MSAVDPSRSERGCAADQNYLKDEFSQPLRCNRNIAQTDVVIMIMIECIAQSDILSIQTSAPHYFIVYNV